MNKLSRISREERSVLNERAQPANLKAMCLMTLSFVLLPHVALSRCLHMALCPVGSDTAFPSLISITVHIFAAQPSGIRHITRKHCVNVVAFFLLFECLSSGPRILHLLRVPLSFIGMSHLPKNYLGFGALLMRHVLFLLVWTMNRLKKFFFNSLLLNPVQHDLPGAEIQSLCNIAAVPTTDVQRIS